MVNKKIARVYSLLSSGPTVFCIYFLLPCTRVNDSSSPASARKQLVNLCARGKSSRRDAFMEHGTLITNQLYVGHLSKILNVFNILMIINNRTLFNLWLKRISKRSNPTLIVFWQSKRIHNKIKIEIK